MPDNFEEIQEFLYSTPTKQQWKSVGVRFHNGINVPLFSLHSQKSTGVGEFPDLIPIIDWCAFLGLDVIQTLPLNDTGIDVSPYSALSAYALNPLHLGLSSLPKLEEHADLIDLQNGIKGHHTGQRVNFQVLYQEREAFLQKYFLAVFHHFKETDEYTAFINKHHFWLNPYALFKTLKIKNRWSPWEEWPLPLCSPNPEEFQTLLDEYASFVSFHQFIQFLCFKQLQQVKQHAEEKKVLIKGDIPILINRESADVWHHPSLFLMQFSAGAPPDFYNSDGQKWGFPLYNWQAIEKEDYRWWRERLSVACNLYHLYRVDHVIGFFRIWAIPKDQSAKDGEFFPQDDRLWNAHGEKIIRMMLDCKEMLPIAEDLGVVPPVVRETLRKLGICGTKVLRWERDWHGDLHFINPQEFDPISMTTVSTHDSETVPLWWRDTPIEAEAYAVSKSWSYQPTIQKEQLFEILHSSHHSASLFRINLLNEYFPLVEGMAWEKPEDERINFPGLVLERNWTYRFRPSVEEIIESLPLANLFKELMN